MNLSGTRFRPGHQTALRKEHRLLLELMFVVLLIALMMSALLEQIPFLIGKTRLLSLIMAPASDGRLKVIEHHAFTGDWLGTTEPDRALPLKVSYEKTSYENDEYAKYLSAWTSRLQQGGYIQQGAVHIEIQNRKRKESATPSEWWSLRPAVAGDDAPTVFWVCGSRPPPAGFHVLGENLTTIPPNENFQFCR